MSYDPRAAGARCDLCPLAKRLDNVVVPPSAPKDTIRLVIVGEGPGRVEERVREPFVGPSGRLLNETLDAKAPKGFRPQGGSVRSLAYVTNAHLCKPDHDQHAALASLCCAPRLLRELKALPKAVPIVALGKAAAKTVLGVNNILLVRGFVWTAKEIEPSAVKAAWAFWRKVVESKPKEVDRTYGWRSHRTAWLKAKSLQARAKLAGRTVLPALHPAFILRSDMWKPVFDVDVERALRLAAGQTLDLKDRGPYEVVATAASARKALAKLGQTVAVDVETDGINPLTTKMLCVGISDGKRTVVVHPPRELEDGWIATGLSRTVQDFLESTRSRENYDERRRRGGDVRRNRLQGM